MIKAEKKFVAWVEKYSAFIFIAVISVLGLAARISAFNFHTADSDCFLLPWFEQIKANGGLAALGEQVGNYNIPYQILIGLLTYIDLEPLWLYKAVSCVFDFVLAAAAAMLAQTLCGSRSALLPCSVYTATLFLPGVILNSAVWAQCDSIYSSFVLLSLLFLFKKKNVPAFIFLGFAIAFKLQAVFILPFFILFYFSAQSFSLLHFIISAVSGYALCLPAFFFGRSPIDPLKIYFSQTNTYRYMYMKFPSIWALIGDNYDYMSAIAVLTAFAVLGIGLMYVIKKKPRLCEPQNFISAACWCVWTCLLFLPAMHERYAYLLDILLLAAAALNRKNIPFAIVAAVSSAACCGIYLFGSQINLQAVAAVYLAAYSCFTYFTVKASKLSD